METDDALSSEEWPDAVVRTAEEIAQHLKQDVTQTARTLERDGIIQRQVFPVVPPRVEYSLTPMGESVIPLIMQMGYWGESIGTY